MADAEPLMVQQKELISSNERFMAVKPAAASLSSELIACLKHIPGGIFEMGARRATFPEDCDSPRRKVKLSPFMIGPYAVTNAEYARFVDATGYLYVRRQHQ